MKWNVPCGTSYLHQTHIAFYAQKKDQIRRKKTRSYRTQDNLYAMTSIASNEQSARSEMRLAGTRRRRASHAVRIWKKMAGLHDEVLLERRYELEWNKILDEREQKYCIRQQTRLGVSACVCPRPTMRALATHRKYVVKEETFLDHTRARGEAKALGLYNCSFCTAGEAQCYFDPPRYCTGITSKGVACTGVPHMCSRCRVYLTGGGRVSTRCALCCDRPAGGVPRICY